jgi:periplasmic protein CpxP/Spy
MIPRRANRGIALGDITLKYSRGRAVIASNGPAGPEDLPREENTMIRTRTRWLLALILGSTLLGPVLAGAADPTTPGTPPAGPPTGRRFQQDLGLTDEQMTAIRQVHAQQAQNRRQVWQSLRQARSDLRQLALNGGDPSAIQAKQAEVTQLLSQEVALDVSSLQAMSPILTPEQRAKLAQMSPQHHGGRARPQQGS